MTADVAKAVFAVVTDPNLVVREPLDEFAVTVPLIAGSEPMVTELPIVTDAMLIACVAGKLRTEMLPVIAPKVVDCDAGKLEMLTAVNVTACDAGKFNTETLPVIDPNVVVWVAGKFEILAVTDPAIVTVFPIVTDAIDMGCVTGKLLTEIDPLSTI